MTHDRATSPLHRHLAAEWQHLRHDPGALHRATGWRIVADAVRDLDEVLVAVGHGRRADGADADRRLRELVLIAPIDPLAGRVALQRLLPGLGAIARRRAAPGAIDELVGAAWMAIATFNPARRPACLPAALLADADERVFRREWRRVRPPEDRSVAWETIPSSDQPDPTVELAEVLRLGRAAGVADDDLDLVRRLVTATPAEVARELDVTERTVRNRRARVTARLRDLSLAA